jgi:uncharacterized protein
MAGIIVQLAISWLIIWFFEKGNLGFLGLYPSKTRLPDFILFFFITAICCACGFFLKMYFAKQQWQLNPNITPALVLNGIWWNIKSVLFEELIFRGVLLYILIKKLGHTKAIIISATAFGIYHWFSQNAFGSPVQMTITFFVTGTMGLLLAYGYSKTFSLYIPIAIHLGWNVTQQFIFSDGPIGNQLFVEILPRPEITVSYLIFFIILLLPMLCMFIINWGLLKRRKQIISTNTSAKFT